MKLTALAIAATMATSAAAADISLIFAANASKHTSGFFFTNNSCEQFHALAIVSGHDMSPITKDESGTWIWVQNNRDGSAAIFNCASTHDVLQLQMGENP